MPQYFAATALRLNAVVHKHREETGEVGHQMSRFIHHLRQALHINL